MISYGFSLVAFEYYLLILIRITSFASVAPFFSQDGVPTRTRIGFCAIVSLLVLYAIAPNEELQYHDIFGYGVLVIKESATGLLIGYAAYICSAIVLLAGNVIDMNIGLSMVSEYDPSMSTQVTVTANIYNRFVMVLLIISNMHQYILKTLIDSFHLIPLGKTVFRSDILLSGMILYFSDLFVVAFRIMMPIFATMLVVNCVLGVMAKVAPQMNMFSVGIQIKVIVGFIILTVLVFLFPEVVDLISHEMLIVIDNILDGLHE